MVAREKKLTQDYPPSEEQMPHADPEKRKAYERQWRAANIEKVREQAKLRTRKYREAHPERVAASKAKNRAKPESKAKDRAYAKGWREANKEAARRYDCLRNWERNNVNPWPYASREELHDNRYIVAERCEYCGADFASIVSTISPREMEHDHRPPFLFRAISCTRCNVSRGYWDARILAVHDELM
jgi:hypothetical protein